MRFSQTFGVTRAPDDDWFDPHLSVDTKLFLDPLLLFITEDEVWQGAHDELIAHFGKCYELVARGGLPGANSASMAHRLLTFPEPAEFCLGYTASGTRGSGSGGRFATQMIDGIAVAIAAGLAQPEHIEEVGILNSGIGADRISDAVCNVLKHRFITYTQEVVARHGIPTKIHHVRNARCHPDLGRWQDLDVELPTNPTNGKPILLVPELLLDDLPILNANDWFDSHLNSDIRTQLNITVGQRVRKDEIVQYARRHPDRVRTWAREQTSRDDLMGYDFADDKKGVVNWDGATAEFAAANPIEGLTQVTNQDELRQLIEYVLGRFKQFVENQRGWSLLWNSDGSEKPEEAAQLLLLGLAQSYLRHFDVEMDREVEMGRGPVDFKVSRGTACRLIIEIKKAHNGKFWNGLANQLPIYLQGDECDEGWFVAIRYRSNKASSDRMRELPRRVAETSRDVGKTIRYAAIDGRRQASASVV